MNIGLSPSEEALDIIRNMKTYRVGGLEYQTSSRSLSSAADLRAGTYWTQSIPLQEYSETKQLQYIEAWKNIPAAHLDSKMVTGVHFPDDRPFRMISGSMPAKTVKDPTLNVEYYNSFDLGEQLAKFNKAIEDLEKIRVKRRLIENAHLYR